MEGRAKPKFLPKFLHNYRKDMDIVEASYFKSHKELPTPAAVKAISQYRDRTFYRPQPVVFEDLNLIVKFGQRVSVSEALCLRAIKQTFGDQIPVPEVFGWRSEENLVFIYMQLVRGDLLHDKWDTLSDEQRLSICKQLHPMINSLREIKQDPADPFIGSIDRQPVLDYIFEHKPRGGPFTTVKQFHDWFSSLIFLGFPDAVNNDDPYRPYLMDSSTIKFSHGDLHRGNIIISKGKYPRILAIIDWEQAGWYPEYWEWCKACHTADCEGEWRLKWMPKFLTPYDEDQHLFALYVSFIGVI